MLDGSRPRWAVYASAALLLYGVIFTSVLLIEPFGATGMLYFADGGGVPAPFIACGLLLLAARTAEPEQRPAWLLCGLGILGWAIGDLGWAYYELALHREAPFPAVTDAFYLSSYVFLFLGALRFAHRRGAALAVRTALDALAVTLAGSALIWRIAVEPIFMDSSAATFEKVLSALYPMGDVLVLFALSLAIFRHREGRLGQVFAALALGVLLILISDVAFAYLQNRDAYTPASILDAGWMLGYVSLGLAALMQMAWQPRYDAVENDLADPAWKQGFPLAVMTAVASWLILDGFDGRTAAFPMVIAVLFMMCAVVLRHLFTLHENIALRLQLERTYEDELDRARIDSVTGTLNRRAIIDLADVLLNSSTSLAVGMADVDGMKQINDGLGHQAGDEALRVVAAALARPSVVVGRYGGDEFLVLIANPEPGGFERFQAAVQEVIAGTQNGEFPVSVSLGFALSALEGPSLPELISTADERMYIEKRKHSFDIQGHPAAAS